jgi:hypothetical protein
MLQQPQRIERRRSAFLKRCASRKLTALAFQIRLTYRAFSLTTIFPQSSHQGISPVSDLGGGHPQGIRLPRSRWQAPPGADELGMSAAFGHLAVIKHHDPVDLVPSASCASRRRRLGRRILNSTLGDGGPSGLR